MLRRSLHEFLEAQTYWGSKYEKFTLVLILLNVVTFSLGTYNEDPPEGLKCKVCLTSDGWKTAFEVVEIVTVVVFSLEYALRVYSVVEENEGKTYRGIAGRLRWVVTDPYSWVDIGTILPFYIDLCVPGDLASSQFLRILRLFRMMRVEGQYLESFDMFGKIFKDNAKLWQTAGFVGFTTWILCSALYYWADKDTVNADTGDKLFRSIPEASYFTLLNLFGEYPLIDTHSNWGRVVGSLVAIVAVVMFAIPTGIIGSGFEDLLSERLEEEDEEKDDESSSSKDKIEKTSLSRFLENKIAVTLSMEDNVDGVRNAITQTKRSRYMSTLYMWTLIGLVLINAVAVSIGTVSEFHDNTAFKSCMILVDVISTLVFLTDYVLSFRAYERCSWIISFEGLLSLFMWLPLFVQLCVLQRFESNDVFRALWLFRLLKLERYQKSFSVFGTIIHRSRDVLIISGFAAIVTWVFASTAMYFTERNNSDTSTSFYYQSVADSMWITLLNLSGESPLWNYSIGGKIVTGLVGIFATGWFGIPIGLLAAGFESWIDDEIKIERFEDSVTSVVKILTDRKCISCYISDFFWDKLSSEDQLKYLRYLHLNFSNGRPTLTSKGWKAREGRLQLVRYESGQRLRFEDNNTFRDLNHDQKMEYLIYCAKRAYRYVHQVDKNDNDTLDLYCRSSVCDVSKWLKRSSSQKNSSLSPTRKQRIDLIETDLEMKDTSSKVESNTRRVVVKFGPRILTCEINERRRISARRDTPLLLDDVDHKAVLSCVASLTGYESDELIVGTQDGEIEDDFDIIVSLKPSRRLRVYRFIEENTSFQIFITFVIVITVIESILSSVKSIDNDHTADIIFNKILEPVAVGIFTLEFVFRLWAVPDDPSYRYIRTNYCTSASNYNIVSRLSHLVSFYAVIDILAIVPWYLTLMPDGAVQTFADDHDEELRLLRLMRLLKLDKFVPSVSLIDDVFRAKSRELRVTGYVAAVFWIVFSTLMFFANRDGHGGPDPEDEDQNAERYRDVPNAFSYVLIHLTGDYPIVNYAFWGKTTCFFMTVVAVGVVAIPSSVFAAGFSEQLAESRKRRRMQRSVAATRIAKVLRGYLCRKKFRRMIAALKDKDSNGDSKKSYRERVRIEQPERHEWLDLLNNTQIRRVVLWLIVANVICVILETVESINDKMKDFFYVFEIFSVAIFSFEYCVRVFTASIQSKYLYSTRVYMFSFYGIVDLLSFFPFYIELIFTLIPGSFDSTIFRIFRLLRLFQLEHYAKAFSLLDDVFFACKDTLAGSGLLALIIWIGSACLFYISERNNGDGVGLDDQGNNPFESIPSSMYYTAVFLGGEWGKTDFTLLGKFVCMFFCIVGIAIFGIPVGAIFEAFSDTLGERQEMLKKQNDGGCVLVIENEEKEEKEEEGKKKMMRDFYCTFSSK